MRYGFLFLIAIVTCVKVSAADKSSVRKQNDSAISIMKLPVADLETGQHLSHAQLYSLPQFVAYYLKTGAAGQSKKHGPEHTRIVFTDKDFTYFVRQVADAYIIRFFKVHTAELQQINLQQLNGKQIRKQFTDEVIPEEDKKWVKKRTKWDITYYDSEFTWLYLPDTKQVSIGYLWKVTDDIGFNIINKYYSAVYDLKSRQFSNVRISAAKKK